MNIAVIIPARYESSRFPGKPMATILGKPMIQHVWEKCIEAFPAKHVYIATDDERIYNPCTKFGAQCLMTSKECLTGTDRVSEAYLSFLSNDYDSIINVQGDEPTINPNDIIKIRDEMYKDDLRSNIQSYFYVYCGYCPITNLYDVVNINVPKVAINASSLALYISRSPIPLSKTNKVPTTYRQVCIYGFSSKALIDFVNYGEQSPLEKIEDIELLRFIDVLQYYKIKMVAVSQSLAVDIPDDIKKVEDFIKMRGI